MIVLDTCSAINCYNISSNWLDRLKKCCVNKKILWSTTTQRELKGLSLTYTSLEDLIERLDKANNVFSIDTSTLSASDFLSYAQYLLDISNNDNTLLFNQFPKGKIDLNILQANGKVRLSDADKELLALSMLKNATLATDDKRILKIIDTFYSTHPYICTPKIIQKIKNITTTQQLNNVCNRKNIYLYPNHHTNKTVVC